jgi:hypothetical protein
MTSRLSGAREPAALVPDEDRLDGARLGSLVGLTLHMSAGTGPSPSTPATSSSPVRKRLGALFTQNPSPTPLDEPTPHGHAQLLAFSTAVQ